MRIERIVPGKWRQVKNQIQKTWNLISEDELEQTQRDLKKITTLVHKRYNHAQDLVRKKIKIYISLTDLVFDGDTEIGYGVQCY